MSGILSNAISGLQASQNALRTAGHNIANANTEGYSRQQVNYATRPEQTAGAAGYIGSGVTTTSIERVVSEFVTAQLRMDTSAYNQLSSYNVNIGKIDKLFADVSTGMSGALQTFFAALQNGANDPASTPGRQLIVTEVNSVSLRFNSLYERMDTLEKTVNSEVNTIAGQINALAQSVAELNKSIAEKRAGGQGNMPNDLMDKRDESLRQLAELVSIQVITEGDGDVNVALGSGEPLVVGTQVSRLSVTNDGKIQLSSNRFSTVDISSTVSGGKLGGLLSFRNEVLSPTQNELGRLALVIADQFNTLQQQGLDLDGDYGQPLFSDINSPANMANRVLYTGTHNATYDRNISLLIEDSNQLSTSDYLFEIVPNTSNYVITRLGDKSIISQGTITGAHPQTIDFDGLRLSLNAGSFQGGDSFVLQPTKTAARDIKSVINRPEDIALASPIRTASNNGNAGTGIVSAGEVLSMLDANGNRLPAYAAAGQLSPPILIRFTSQTTYEVLDNSDPANPKPLVPALREQVFVPGVSNAIFTGDIGETLVVGKGERLGLPAGREPQTLAALGNSMANGYLAEQLRFTTTDPTTGAVSTRTITTVPGASAAQTAAQISAIGGVTASAHTTANLTNLTLNAADFTQPTQLYINGEPLIGYDPQSTAFAEDVPDINVEGEAAFNDYLAARINANPNLQTLGLRAQSSTNPVTGAPELRLVASSGVDLDIRLVAASGNASSVDVNDASGNPSVRLQGVDSGAGEQQGIVVGGRIDVTLANGVRLNTTPANSPLFGDSTAADFASSSYTGYQVSIAGQPKAGDTFSIEFNTNAKNDNRNALAFVELQSAKILQGGSLTLGDAYGKLVEEVGTKSSLSKINTEASRTLLTQTQSMRDSISGVNLDEEASDLIRFQQLYQANARVITVARELFDTLLNAL